MPKQSTPPKYIFKLHSERLRKSRWKLSLSLSEARRNDEIISLSDSQILRWIDMLNGCFGSGERVSGIKSEIKRIHREKNSRKNKAVLCELYSELDRLQFKPDYMCLIIDKEKDYYRASKGFYINDVKYVRLLGTNGGIKNSTIVFVSERLSAELRKRIENGRDETKPLVTAKLEAYRALVCSASDPVSLPKGVLVVNDCEVSFKSDVIFLSDENDGEPIMQERKNENIKLNASDGFGIMLPSLAKRWAKELNLDYLPSGVNTRFAFEKGMVFTFDFIGFADKIAHNYIVKDAWGNDFDIRNAELILTTSMVKLWDSYEDIGDYIGKSLANGYTFAVTKVCPKELRNERSLNYQFIQSFDLDDEAIEKLISPTVSEFKEVLEDNPVKTALFLGGTNMNERNIERVDSPMLKAIMIDGRIAADSYVKKSVYRLIKNRINEAKIGVIKVHGDYSIASGDPYSLCQSIFGLTPTGLLKANEIYNKYWFDKGADKLICFRAPMTCHNNVLAVSVSKSEEAAYWYRYMRTCMIFNSHDTSMCALNGMDFDGDLVMLTDNSVLLEHHKPLPSLMCVQRKAEKVVPCEKDFIRSNIQSFGNDIGKITNRITAMYEVRSRFSAESEEYGVLSYRIMCGQLFQQNAIDKAKGIIAKPMPRNWFDKHAVSKSDEDEKRDRDFSLLADKKPYFMRYIYPALMREYNNYIKNTDIGCMRRFGVTVSELKAKETEKLTEEEINFLEYYGRKMPVGMGDCVMNRICKRFENEFDGFAANTKRDDFDYAVMKSSVTYSKAQFYAVREIYGEYLKRASENKLTSERGKEAAVALKEEFSRRCDEVCSNRRVLCNIILDLCYQKDTSKSFAWEMCGDEIVQNLLEKNGGKILLPVKKEDGSIRYCGNRFEIKEVCSEYEYSA